jgi:hypothetical protein
MASIFGAAAAGAAVLEAVVFAAVFVSADVLLAPEPHAADRAATAASSISDLKILMGILLKI